MQVTIGAATSMSTGLCVLQLAFMLNSDVSTNETIGGEPTLGILPKCVLLTISVGMEEGHIFNVLQLYNGLVAFAESSWNVLDMVFCFTCFFSPKHQFQPHDPTMQRRVR